MWANIEHFQGGIIRVFDDASQYGEPYVFSIAFKACEDPNMIELVGATRAPTTSQLRAIARELRSHGIKVRRVRLTGAHPGTKQFE